MEEVPIYLPDYEVRDLVQKLVLLNLEPVCSSVQHKETDSRKIHCKMDMHKARKTGRKKERGFFPTPSSASSEK